MREIINGKKYDTETAKLIGHYGNGLPESNFRWMYEELYLKRTGEFFLWGEGGPMSPYVRALGNNNYTDGCALVPLTHEKARAWVEEHLSYEDYVELFGEPEE